MCRLVGQWVSSVITNAPMSAQEQQEKVRDLLFGATLVFAGTSHAGRPPRLDFFLMHILTPLHFMSYMLEKFVRPKNRAHLASHLSVLISLLFSACSPKLDGAPLMS
jgi:hypothetical protein